MTIKLYRQNDPADPQEVGTFKALGDAMWAATCYQSHLIIGAKGRHWVEVRKGKRVEVYYPAYGLNADMFELIGR